MKRLIRNMLVFLVRVAAIRALAGSKTSIIAITGSVGKTATKDAVALVVAHSCSLRKSERNYNNEIGTPLALLGMGPGTSRLEWLLKIIKVMLLVVVPPRLPDTLVLEMGADHPGDIQYLTSFIKPHVAVVTAVACAHTEFFKTLDGVAKEKGVLAKAVDRNGWVVLNADDLRVATMRQRAKGRVITYGIYKKADIYATNIFVSAKGTSFVVHYKNTKTPFMIPAIGAHTVYAALAAIACGIIYNISLGDISFLLSTFHTEAGRMTVRKGVKRSMILDDTYNANPASVKAGIEAMNDLYRNEDIHGKRIAVLGDMLELGKDEKKMHADIGRYLIGKADAIIAVGARSEALFDALRRKFPKYVWHVARSEDVALILKPLVEKDDIILIKGSRGMKMEKVVKALTGK